jgi:hypothetical protein
MADELEPSLSRPIELVPKSASENRVSEATWAKMGNAERLDYCRRFDQSKFTGEDR